MEREIHMTNGLLLTGVVAAGITAAYLMDEKRGPKRRKLLKKKADRVFREAAGRFNDASRELKPYLDRYSRELKPYWDRYSSEVTHGAEELKAGSIRTVEKAAQNGWSPSARMLGATASAMAFYGAGRKGPVGQALRLLSLGLFVRALFAAR